MIIKCEICGINFERKNSEINRNKKFNRRTFCSKKCSGKALIKNIPQESYVHDHLNPSNKLDEYSPFRWHLKVAKQRNKKVTITLQDLKQQWEKQNGICPFTGWELKNMPCTNHSKQLPKTPDRASLDRIDSSKGYEPNNIQYVSMIAQYAKSEWTSDLVYDFCESVMKNKKPH